MSNYNSQLQSNNTDLQTVLQTLQTKAAGGEQATPVISVNSTNGLITATAGTKSSTHQLAFQPAKTITPSTASQIAVSSGYYTGGNVMVAGDSNLVASNIKSGVSIFGVSGTLEEGGGSSGEAAEWSENEDAIVSGTISTYTNDRVTNIGRCAFYSYSKLTTVNFPAATTIDYNAFAYCRSLKTVSFPSVTSIGASAFCRCTGLTTASFPACTSIGSFAFDSCPELKTVNFPVATIMGSGAFQNCSSLTTVSFPAATSIGANAFGFCTSLTTASFPAVTTISINAFQRCSKLTTVSFPVATIINTNAFFSCHNLTTISFPVVTTIGTSAFCRCTGLTTASFPACTSIGSFAFAYCSRLTTFFLTGSSVPTLYNSNAFATTSMSTTGYFYVPSSLIASYQAATNWTYFSSRFFPVEDYDGWDGVYGSGT